MAAIHIAAAVAAAVTAVTVAAVAIVAIADTIVMAGADVSVANIVGRCDWHGCNSNRTIFQNRTFACHTTD